MNIITKAKKQVTEFYHEHERGIDLTLGIAGVALGCGLGYWGCRKAYSIGTRDGINTCCFLINTDCDWFNQVMYEKFDKTDAKTQKWGIDFATNIISMYNKRTNK